VSSPAPPGATAAGARDVAAVLGAGAAVLLAAAPLAGVVAGGSWLGHAAVAVGLVTAVGLLPPRVPAPAVVAAQGAAWLALMCALFTSTAVLGVLPGPAALGELGALLVGAREQVASGLAPVAPTPEILLLVTGSIGLVAIVVQAVAVGAGAPAAAGIPLLILVAVPVALDVDPLPWWALVAPAVGFGVLLAVRSGVRARLPGAAALVAAAAVVGLVAGLVTPMVGTAGRFGTGTGGGGGGAIGLSPFTSVRGQLAQTAPAELFRVRGLPRPTYLRALTLRDFVVDVGFAAGRPGPGPELPGAVPLPPGVTGPTAVVTVENVGFRDYWLPVYGAPAELADLQAQTWIYDGGSGTAYSRRPQEEDGWTQVAVLPEPTAEQLRAAGSVGGDPVGTADAVPAAYLRTVGVDERVAELAAEVTAGATTDFDRAVALVDWFTAPGSTFEYSLATTPGSGDDALVEFLTVGRTGYCEQFATAMAVMLRTLGVPSRVAVGFTAGSDEGEHRSVSTADAHAWVEVWFDGLGWTVFDPTPLADGRAIVPPYVEQARARDLDGAADVDAGDPSAGAVPSAAPLAGPDPADFGTPVPGAPAAEAGGFPFWPVVVLVLGGLALAPTLLRRRERARRLGDLAQGGPGAAAAGWAELLAESTDRGVPPVATDTVRAAARRMVREHRLDEGAQQALRQVVVAVEAGWYAQQAAPAPPELAEAVRTVRAAIVASGPPRLRDRVVPPSVVSGSAAALRRG